MKRPLALFAVSFFAFQLLALNLPQQVLLPIAAVFVCLLVACVLKKKLLLGIILSAASIALIWNVVYINAIIKPSFKYIGTTHTVVAQIKSTKLYATSNMSADLTIYEIDGQKVSSFNVKANNLPHAQVGEYIEAKLTFKHLSATKRLFSYTDGVFLSAEYVDSFKSQQKYTVFYYANMAQQYLSGKIQLLMPNENGYAASAMAFGDKSKLTWEMKNSFKAAGLSHLLVVSGMHLAAASGIAYLLFNSIFKKRQISAIASIMFIVVFAFVTGITPSALRAGIMLSIAYLGMCFYREADSFTSIALAGLVMCVYNPYICYDVGFLLSYTATLGVLYSNEILKKLSKTKLGKNKPLFFAVKVIALPTFATLATMPILIAFNLGISALGVIFNIVITPFLGVITTITFLCVLFSTMSIFMPLAILFSYINTALISAMLFAVRLADKIPWSLIYISGAGATLILVALYVLLFLQLKYKPKFGAAAISVLFIVTVITSALVNSSMVNIAPISHDQNSSVLLWTQNKGVLFNREKTVDVQQVQAFLKQNNVSSLELIINMNKDGNGLSDLKAEKTINVYDDFNFACSYEPITGIIVNMKKQEKGTAAFVSINGFSASLNNGEYNFDKAYYSDVYISGISRGLNISADNIITPGNTPKWLSADNISQNAQIVISKSNLYKINEGFYGFD